MQRYFFHTQDGQSFHDADGTLLADDDAARVEAARVLGQLVNEHPSHIWRDDQFHIVVTDESGLVLFQLELAAMNAPTSVRPDLGRPR